MTPAVDRRRFLRDSAAALSLGAVSGERVRGANDWVRVAFLGCGARAQAHIHVVTRLAGVTPVMVCDVWSGHADEYVQTWGGKSTPRRYSQGRTPSALACGLCPDDPRQSVTDYRRVLDRPDVDAVVISTPDHWHARMLLDAVAAGKDVLCETPLVRTTGEAHAVAQALAATDRVVAVGEQTLTHPSLKLARELVEAGRIGHAGHLSAGVFRSDARGEWRYTRIVKEMTRANVDWDLFLGHRFEVAGTPVGPTPAEMPFDPVSFAQWRCLAPFSAGPLSDWLTRPAARLMHVAGALRPTRVVAAGGLFHDRDGRTVPDTVTVAADFSGCHLLLTASTCAAGPGSELIRGRRGTLTVHRHAVELAPHDPAGGPPPPAEALAAPGPAKDTEALWVDFIDCVRRRDRATACPPGLGLAAAGLIAAARDSQ